MKGWEEWEVGVMWERKKFVGGLNSSEHQRAGYRGSFDFFQIMRNKSFTTQLYLIIICEITPFCIWNGFNLVTRKTTFHLNRNDVILIYFDHSSSSPHFFLRSLSSVFFILPHGSVRRTHLSSQPLTILFSRCTTPWLTVTPPVCHRLLHAAVPSSCPFCKLILL
ncbi:hypothetical protein I3842_05G139500 [Carya illinoinensis]|uniref:Uncharacterized protein n=1 Tax=Carya illinoinensis TaxID=32201 RepID=A0A922JQD0_CARIL|nr:hypothetical protein I3842_05G139500 [Carya illinoinensis]